MMRSTAITLLAALVLTGCAGPSPLSILFPPTETPTPTPTPAPRLAADPAEIMGTWQGTFTANPAYLIFGDAGNLTVSQAPDGSLGAVGQYFFEGTRLALRTDLPFAGCDLASTGYYEVRLDQQDGAITGLRFTLVEDPCLERTVSLVNETLVWVRP